MANQPINFGTTANDGTGDTLRDMASKVNGNFSELYTKFDSAGAGGIDPVSGNQVRHIMPYPTGDLGGSAVGLTSEIQTKLNEINTTLDVTLDLGGHTYIVDAEIEVYGQNSLRITNGKLIKSSGYTGTTYKFISFYGCEDIKIDNMTFIDSRDISGRVYATDGASWTSSAGIYLNSCNQVTISSIHVTDMKYGVMINASSKVVSSVEYGGQKSEQVTLSDSIFVTSTNTVDTSDFDDRGGSCIYSQDAADWVIVANNQMSCWNKLTLSGVCQNWTIQGNVIRVSGDSPIYVKGIRHSITGNAIYKAGKDSIKVRTSDTVGDSVDENATGFSTITGNFCFGAGYIKTDGGVGIQAYGPNNVVSSNTIILDSDAAVVTNACSGIKVSGRNSIVTNNSIVGPWVTGNTTNTSRGISMNNDDQGFAGNGSNFSGDNGIFSNNNISGCRYGVWANPVSRVSPAQDFTLFRTQITDNNIDSCGYGIRLYPGNSTDRAGDMGSFVVKGNNLNSIETTGVQSNGGGVVVIDTNNFTSMGSKTLRIQGAGDIVTVRNNSWDTTGETDPVEVTNNGVESNVTEIGNTWNAKASTVLDVVTKTADYTANIITDSIILCDATSGVVTITLPTSVGNAGKTFSVKKIDASGNNVVVDGNGSQTIDGSTTQTISTQYDEKRIVSDGSNWFII